MENKRQHPLIWNNRTIKAQTQTNGQKDRMEKKFAVKGLCDTLVRVLIFHNKSLPPSTNSNQFELSQLGGDNILSVDPQCILSLEIYCTGVPTFSLIHESIKWTSWVNF